LLQNAVYYTKPFLIFNFLIGIAMKAHVIFYLILIIALLPLNGLAQLMTVTGYVNNQSTGEAKQNVAVFERLSGIGTITNSEGYYRLLLYSGKRNLEISSSGFNSYNATFSLKADTIISVELTPLGYRSDDKTEDASPKGIFIVSETIKNEQKPEK
jgi:hypothetical protein